MLPTNRIAGYFVSKMQAEQADDKPDSLPPLARNLRRLRGHRTQQQICDATGISIGSYRNWENGYTDRITNPEAIKSLTEHYGITPEALFADSDHPSITVEPADEFEQFLIQQLKAGLKGKYRHMLIDAITLAAKHS